DGGSVGRVEVDEPIGGVLLPELRVAPGDVRVGQLDVALLRPTDYHAALVYLVTLSVDRQRDELLRERDLGRRPVVGDRRARLVDHRRAGSSCGGGTGSAAAPRPWAIRVAMPNSPIERSSSVSNVTVGGVSRT